MGFHYKNKKNTIYIFCALILLFACSRQSQSQYEIPSTTGDGWKTASLSDVYIDPLKINDLISAIRDKKFKHIHSVIIVKNGKLVLEEYFKGYNRDKLHPIQSDTKSVTSILIGIAIDHRIIPGLDKMIYDYFEYYAGTKWIDQQYQITLKHALTMTAGLDWDERTHPYGDARNENTAMNNSIDWIKYILNKNTAHTPGERFNYASGLSVLLGAIIKKAAGLSADGFAQKHLFKPLGITEYQWYQNWDHTIHTGGGLRLKPRDMAKIGHMMLNGGVWQGRQIVSPGWVRESTQAHVKTGGHDYGYQWWCGKSIHNNRIVDAFWAAGHGGQYIFVLPSLDLVVVFTAKHRKNPGSSGRAFTMLKNYIIPAVLPLLPSNNAIKLPEDDLEACVGTYCFSQEQEPIAVTIFRDGNKLYGRSQADAEIVALFPVTETQFYGTSQDISDFRITFVKSNNGEINHFKLQFARRFVLFNFPFERIQ